MNKLIKATLLTAACVVCTTLITSTAYAEDLILDYSDQSCSDDILFDNNVSADSDDILISVSRSRRADDLLTVEPVDDDILVNPVADVPGDEIIITNPSYRTVNPTPVVTNPTPVVTNPTPAPADPTPSEPVVTSGKTLPSVTVTSDMKRALELINQQRTKAGLKPLTMSTTLNSIAYLRANEASQKYSHIRPNGKQCISIYSEYGISYNCAGENLAVGQKTAERAVSAWMMSSSHMRCMLNADYTQVGISCIQVNGVTYWALSLIG